MESFSSLTSKFRVHKPRFPSAESPRGVNRPKLACVQCQKSKVRCDRDQPCGGCTSKDRGATCSYSSPGERHGDGNRNVTAENRLLHLEVMIKELMQRRDLIVPPRPVGNATIPECVAVPGIPDHGSEAIVIGESTPLESSTYVGSTHWSAILDDIQELKVALNGTSDAPEKDQISIPEVPNKGSELIFGTSDVCSSEQLIAESLPPKVEVDRYLSTYFQDEAFIIPFIHAKQFQRQYQDFWKEPASVNPLWLSILFSLCHLAALSKAVIGSHGEMQNSPRSSAFHEAAGQCLVMGQYHRPQKFSLQALGLYAQCKNMMSIDPSREAGLILAMIVRMAYEMGYHRDPDSFGSFTPFEGEMRRRLWASCKQMDMMISFQLGLPSNIRLEACDTKSPRNLNDSDFDEDTLELPQSHAEGEVTKLSWFVLKERQMGPFSKVCQDALSVKETSESEILRLDAEVREMHATFPDALRARPLSDSIADPPFLIMTRLYIEFIHLKSLCVLHRKYMVRGKVFSTKSCIEAGMALVSSFIDMYREMVPGGQLHVARWMLGNFTLNDFLLGVMLLCLVMHIRRKSSPRSSIFETTKDSDILELLEQSYLICNGDFKASKDARKVSRAIRLTLNASRPSSQPGQTALHLQWELQGSSAPVSIHVESQHPVQSIPAVGFLNQEMTDDDTAFDPLDPFNFMANDFESTDHTLRNIMGHT